jgi:hypothetical protein
VNIRALVMNVRQKMEIVTDNGNGEQRETDEAE